MRTEQEIVDEVVRTAKSLKIITSEAIAELLYNSGNEIEILKYGSWRLHCKICKKLGLIE